MSSVDGARSVQGASDETFENLCDPCNYEGTNVEAVKFCYDCKEWLCPSCTDSHRRFKTSRNHKILSVTQVPKQAAAASKSCVVLCENCQNLEVTYYCEQHHVVICQACKSMKHRKCQSESIKEKGKSYDKTKLRPVAEKTKAIEGQIDEFLRERNDDLQHIASVKETCAEEMKTFREELTKWLDMLEQKIMQELTERESHERQKLERHISTTTTTKQMLTADSKLLEDAKKSSIKSDMFATDVKVSNRVKEYETLLQDMCEEAGTPTMIFTRNKQLTDIQNQVNTLGTLTVDYIQTNKPKSKLFQDMKVESSSQVDIKLPDDRSTPFITGCEILQDGPVILCDFANKKVKLLHSSFIVKESLELPAGPWDVSVINSTSAIITLPESHQLQYIQLEPSLKSELVIQLEKRCYGIEMAGKDIYITLNNNPGEGEVRILDMEGHLKRRLDVTQGGRFMFQTLCYLALSTTRKVYVSDVNTATVACLTSDGTVVYQYKDKGLLRPRGICVDAGENIIVCDENSYNVQSVTASGKKHGNMLTASDGLAYPCSIAYRHTDDTLIIGCWNQNQLFVCKVAR